VAPTVETNVILAISYLIALIVAWIQIPGLLRPSRPLLSRRSFFRRHPVVALAAFAAAARALPSFLLDRGLPFDVAAHFWIGLLTLAGRNPYTDPLAQGRYPYPPLHAVLSAALVTLSGGDRALFLVLDKLAPALGGVLLSVVLYAAARRLGQSPSRALRAGLLYALNPLPVLVTAYHGQFEELPLAGIGLAVLLLSARPGARVRGVAVVGSGLAVGLAVAYKTWPLLFVPGLLAMVEGTRRRLLYPLAVLAPLAVSIALFALAFGRGGVGQVLARLREYEGSNGFCWGYVALVRECWVHPLKKRPNLWVLTFNKDLLYLCIGLLVLLLLLRRRPLETLVAVPLAFVLFTPGWGPNYSIWMLPFALLYSPRLAVRYTVVVLPVVALTYLDSLYAAYPHVAFSWNVLKPLEAGLGLIGWGGTAWLFASLYRPSRRSGARTAQALNSIRRPAATTRRSTDVVEGAAVRQTDGASPPAARACISDDLAAPGKREGVLYKGTAGEAARLFLQFGLTSFSGCSMALGQASKLIECVTSHTLPIRSHGAGTLCASRWF